MSTLSIEEQARLLVEKDGGVIVKDGDKKKKFKPIAPGEHIYNSEALLQKLEEIEYKPKMIVKETVKSSGKKEDKLRVPWIETMALTAEKPLIKTKSNEDVRREALFQEQTLELVKEAYRRFRVMKIPANRPSDFYAEMFKTDEQMDNIKKRMVEEQRRIKIVDQRKKNKEASKFAKSTMVERQKLKASKKKKMLYEIQEFKNKIKEGNSSSKFDENNLENIIEGRANDGSKGGSKGKGKGKGGGKGGKGGGKGGKGGGKGSKGAGKGSKGAGKGGKGGKGKGNGKGKSVFKSNKKANMGKKFSSSGGERKIGRKKDMFKKKK